MYYLTATLVGYAGKAASTVAAVAASPLPALALELAALYLVARLAWAGFWWLWDLGDSYTHYTQLRPVASRARSVSLPPARLIECVDKGTGEVLGAVPAMSADEINAAIETAVAAQASWGRSSFAARKRALQALLDMTVANQEEICRYSALDSGKTMMEAAFGEILTVAEKLRWTIANGEAALASETRSPGFMMHKGAHVEYRPLGVIGIICPYNYPFHHILSPLATALFAGNAAVIKVSEWTTWSLHASYARLVNDALAAAGVPDGLVQFVTGYGDAGAAIVASPLVDKIFFTGSPATGKKVMLAAAETLKPVILELGGKDPLIVCDDANFELAFQYACRAFLGAGQGCISCERELVHVSHLDTFLARMKAVAEAMRVGPPLEADQDMGAITFPGQIDIVQRLVDDAVAKGATLVTGGKALKVKGGYYYAPTILTDLNDSMRIMHEEVFGPVMLVIAFETDADAVRIANATELGLSCSVFSASPARANRIVADIKSGMAVVNDYGITYTMQSLPFGGVKHSGFGRFNGVEGLREASATVAVVTERWGLPTSLPKPFEYPIQNHSFALVETAIRMGYSAGILAKLRGFLDFIGVIRAGPSDDDAVVVENE
ncbi:aldehyde dehydrogenase [Thecamonas trahens ATCC 50062]|uniref:Aldehyde dehydrogenase n=1 Tax=Thecamonas trahens ATCC 50062 TaxID=461836 RepID=A0A0L0DGU2_THETB|nr:aldehyde dehydrogenase [Thecamonas trahens ATCC 50062]KNC50548.1 aldehyde dehydrogenase [Thecamonas trahens ATCC 50062]|eukprot:XP_013762438.1 aldehyde dehydrogenase [Thecamonas trahens ATCC 50062]